MDTTKERKASVKMIPRGGFWKDRTDAIICEAIPYQWKALNNKIPGAPPSHAVQNFRIAAGEDKGERQGTIFQDSDIAKWIEAASYSLRLEPNVELEKTIDDLIVLIQKSQMADGYVNTYFIASSQTSGRWSDLVMGHELYCAGHMIEASVAYFYVTGKKTFLNVMCKYADYIGTVFGQGENQNHGFDGHPEIELALHRLAEATGEIKYAELANYFVDIRGSVPNFHKGKAAKDGMIPNSKWFDSDYYLADKPVREMSGAQGHSVRAMYLYSAMADQYLMTNDDTLLIALKRIWDNVVKKHLYITGGLGAHPYGERFSIDYDLPNDTCYTETCASIGLAMWSWRMLCVEKKREYTDIMERTIYNGILSGISLDCTKYFYVNPLYLNPAVANFRQDHAHVTPSRLPWFDCACCPTNVARFVLLFTEYMYSFNNEGLWIHHFADGSAVAYKGKNKVTLNMKTNYPWDGKVTFSIDPEEIEEFNLHMRIPGWCSTYKVTINSIPLQDDNLLSENGYLCITRSWNKGDLICLEMEMPVRFISTNSKVHDNAGKIAIQRGPVLYCAEATGNEAEFQLFCINLSKVATLVHDPSLPEGTVAIDVPAVYNKIPETSDQLYVDFVPEGELKTKIMRFIPYYQWGNRNPGNAMSVWFRYVH